MPQRKRASCTREGRSVHIVNYFLAGQTFGMPGRAQSGMLGEIAYQTVALEAKESLEEVLDGNSYFSESER